MMDDRKIRVRFIGDDEIREVSFEEARAIVEDVYKDDLGGFAVDGHTLEIITGLTSGIDEIIVVQQVLGGG